MFTTFSQHIHNIFKTFSQYFQSFSQHVHNMFILCSQCFHNIFSTFSTFWQLVDNLLTTVWQLFDNFLITFWQLFDRNSECWIRNSTIYNVIMWLENRYFTHVIDLNHDIPNFSNVIVPLFEEVHWRQILFLKFCFRDNFEGKVPMGVKCLS